MGALNNSCPPSVAASTRIEPTATIQVNTVQLEMLFRFQLLN